MRTRNGNVVKVDDNNNSISLETKEGGKITVQKNIVTITGNLDVIGNLKVTGGINTSSCNLQCTCE